MFFTRLISGIGLLTVAILAFYIGSVPLILLSVLVSVIGLFEFYRALGLEKKNIAYLGYIYSLIYYYIIHIYTLFAYFYFLTSYFCLHRRFSYRLCAILPHHQHIFSLTLSIIFCWFLNTLYIFFYKIH